METQVNMNLRKIIKKIIREQKEEEMNAAPTHPIKGEKPTNPDEPTSRKDTSYADPHAGKKPGYNPSQGCHDENALNCCFGLIHNANKCEYPEGYFGCTDEEAINYSSDAQEDDGSCVENCCAEQSEATEAFDGLLQTYYTKKATIEAIGNYFITEVIHIDENAYGGPNNPGALGPYQWTTSNVLPDCIQCPDGPTVINPSPYWSMSNLQIVFMDGTVASLEGTDSMGYDLNGNSMSESVFSPIPQHLETISAGGESFFWDIPDTLPPNPGQNTNWNVIGDYEQEVTWSDGSTGTVSSYDGSILPSLGQINFDAGHIEFYNSSNLDPACFATMGYCINNYNYRLWKYAKWMTEGWFFQSVVSFLQSTLDQLDELYNEGCCPTDNARTMPPSMNAPLPPPQLPEENMDALQDIINSIDMDTIS